MLTRIVFLRERHVGELELAFGNGLGGLVLERVVPLLWNLARVLVHLRGF